MQRHGGRTRPPAPPAKPATPSRDTAASDERNDPSGPAISGTKVESKD